MTVPQPGQPGQSAGTGPDVDAWYAEQDDPFGVGTRWYERRKRAVVAAALQRERYRLCWDAACGTGHLAQDLVLRCERLVASDAAARAVELTRGRLSGAREPYERPAQDGPGAQCGHDARGARGGHDAPGVQVLRHRLPAAPPGLSGCDLVLLSEVLYYLDDAARAALPDLLEQVTRGTEAPEVLAVTWRHHPHDGHLSGAAAQAEFGAGLRARGWEQAVEHQETDFVLHSWTATPGGQ